ncbi:sulfite exporter TauE/SafE family protein [Thalassotalea castellviae]|uniref:Probable membrane transporter protein n=1 Tax=Thalassotalea castellviae TaxID=3075612 RepID=A0ABU3A5R4_9GAMM|nr:sulfite exporter TauE/SafE family protein [Thalassotalea sp. W431]MDT0604336.1 sulfite exporter TauE/SafE family protein [Thalassotalea sp. W431]
MVVKNVKLYGTKRKINLGEVVMEPSAALLIAIVVLLIGISKSAFAGALGVFAVPLLMFKFTAIEAITLMLPLLIIADTMSIKSFWKKWDKELLALLIPGAIVGIVIANLLIDYINSGYLRNIIAYICIIFALKNIFFQRLQLSFIQNRVGAYFMSACSGISSTLVHAGGPPLIIYFTAIGLPRTQFVATAAAFFAVMNIIKLMGVLSLGLLSIETVITALAFFPLALVGNWLGLKINQNLDKQLFEKVMNYVLLILGGWLAVN